MRPSGPFCLNLCRHQRALLVIFDFPQISSLVVGLSVSVSAGLKPVLSNGIAGNLPLFELFSSDDVTRPG